MRISTLIKDTLLRRAATILAVGMLAGTSAELSAAKPIPNELTSKSNVKMTIDTYGWRTSGGFMLCTLRIQNDEPIPGDWQISAASTGSARPYYDSPTKYSVVGHFSAPAKKTTAFDFALPYSGSANSYYDAAASLSISGTNFAAHGGIGDDAKSFCRLLFSSDISKSDPLTSISYPYNYADFSKIPPDMRLILGIRGIVYKDTEWEKLPIAWRSLLTDWCMAGGQLTLISSGAVTKKQLVGLEKTKVGEGIKDLSGKAKTVTEKFGAGKLTRFYIPIGGHLSVTDMLMHSSGTSYDWSEINKGAGQDFFLTSSHKTSAESWLKQLTEHAYNAATTPSPLELISTNSDNTYKELLGERNRAAGVTALFALIFFIIIVPVNIIYCRKKNIARLYVTIPAISLVGTIILFISIFTIYGVGGSGSIVRLTYLNSATKKAFVSTQYFCKTGLLINRDFKLSPNTYLITTTPEEERSKASMNLSRDLNGNAFGDWFVNNSRQSLASAAYEDARASLHVTRDAAGTPSAYSELPVEFAHVIYKDAAGTLWRCDNLRQGEKIVMKKGTFPPRQTLAAGTGPLFGIPDEKDLQPGLFYAFAKHGTTTSALLSSIRWEIASDVYYGLAE